MIRPYCAVAASTVFVGLTIHAVLRCLSRIAVEIKGALNTFIHEPMDLVGEDLAALNRREIAVWSKLVREHGIKLSSY